MDDHTFDLIVVGGGSAGYAAARTAVDAGARVAVVDRGPLGGLCILRGCMPSKALLRSAELAADMRRAKEFGLMPVEVHADLGAMVERKNRLVREFADDRRQALRDGRFTLIEEVAAFRSPSELQVGQKVLQAKTFIIATGSTPSQIALPGLAEAGYLTSDTIMDLREQPRSLAVLGGGAVATELGQFFSRIGTKVTVIQRGARLVSTYDADVGSALEQAFRADGITVFTKATVTGVESRGTERIVHLQHDGHHRTVTVELILQALGRRPDIAGLHLEAAGVLVKDGAPVIGADLRTSQPHIFAVGDANGLTSSVHVAIQQGEVAASNALSPEQPARVVDQRLNLEVVFTDPQVAVLGLTENHCRATNVPYLAASYPFADHGKAMCLGRIQGFVKLVCHAQSGTLLGAHIVGPEAGELIHELAAVLYYHGTVHDLLRIPHYHPTLAEIVTYPAEELIGRLHAST